ncbi:tripartite tricarboxylate transporter TctB family protein [Marivita sp. S2033]|uniref:tripartite tricarboxylate transporter TctB family protein n=1 Tax=Marivita sp. S2033 TaxID=3373187 RepID=UPI00398219C5
MADRIFAGVLFLVTVAYAIIAFVSISAPFQYDPLGPESWPQILSVIALLCLVHILWKPDVDGLEVNRPTIFRLLFMVALMIVYAELYEPVGFIISTILFGALTARMLGATLKHSAVFGLAAGIGGYLLCAILLDLNLPEGELVEALLEMGDT